MKHSRADLLAMQLPSPKRTDEEKLNHLREMRKEQMRLARSWMVTTRMDIQNGAIVRLHIQSAKNLHNEIKQIQLKIKNKES